MELFMREFLGQYRLEPYREGIKSSVWNNKYKVNEV